MHPRLRLLPGPILIQVPRRPIRGVCGLHGARECLRRLEQELAKGARRHDCSILFSRCSSLKTFNGWHGCGYFSRSCHPKQQFSMTQAGGYSLHFVLTALPGLWFTNIYFTSWGLFQILSTPGWLVESGWPFQNWRVRQLGGYMFLQPKCRSLDY